MFIHEIIMEVDLVEDSTVFTEKMFRDIVDAG